MERKFTANVIRERWIEESIETIICRLRTLSGSGNSIVLEEKRLCKILVNWIS